MRLAAFNLPSIAKLTMTDELHLQELGERKIALFCCIPDSDKSLNYLVGMIYGVLTQLLSAVNTIPVWSICFSARPAKPMRRSGRKPLSGTS